MGMLLKRFPIRQRSGKLSVSCYGTKKKGSHEKCVALRKTKQTQLVSVGGGVSTQEC